MRTINPAKTRSGIIRANINHSGANPVPTTVMITTHNESRSANGSSHFPTVVTWSSLRARYPSIQYVENRMIKVIRASQYRSWNINQTKTGTSRNLTRVTRLGMVSQLSVTVYPELSSDDVPPGRVIWSSKQNIPLKLSTTDAPQKNRGSCNRCTKNGSRLPTSFDKFDTFIDLLTSSRC